MEQNAKPHAPARRNHLPEFKAQVVDECAQPGASVVEVALSHALNPSLVRRWRRLARQAAHGALGTPSAASATPHPFTPPVGAGTGTNIGLLPLVAANATAAKVVSTASNAGTPVGTSGTFIALAHPTPQALETRHGAASVGQVDSIHVDILRTHAHVHVRWPTSAASDCALWLKDLLHDPPQGPYEGPRADVRRRGARK